MQFPHVRRSFQALREKFYKQSGDFNIVHKNELRNILLELGANESDLNQTKIDEIFNTSVLDQTNAITFKKFLIAAALGCFLAESVNNTNPEFLAIRKGFLF